MNHIPTFEDFINESLLTEGVVEFNLKSVPKIVKDFNSRTKYISNIKNQGRWSAVEEPIIITDKDFEVKGKSATGNYLLLSLYKFAGECKIEWAAVRPDAKYPNGIGIFQKVLDEGTWNSLMKAHQRKMVDPKSINANDIKRGGDILGKFIEDELNLMASPNSSRKGQFDGADDESVKDSIQNEFGEADVTIKSRGKVRVDFSIKDAQGGKTNLWFMIYPEHRQMDFHRPDFSGHVQDTYSDMKSISKFIKDSIKIWKAENKAKADAYARSSAKED
jgi:hypothetical protein